MLAGVMAAVVGAAELQERPASAGKASTLQAEPIRREQQTRMRGGSCSRTAGGGRCCGGEGEKPDGRRKLISCDGY